MKNIKPKRKGRPPLHGGYSLMVRAGELPQNRRYIRAYLSAARAGIVKDLGPTEQDLTAGQLILIDRVICKLGVLRCIEEHIREGGIMRGQNVAPVLQASYLGYSREVRLDLAALGIKTRAGEGIIDLQAYVREHDKQKSRGKARTGVRKAVAGQVELVGPGMDDKAESEIVPLRGRGDDISGPGEGAIDSGADMGQDQAAEGGKIDQPKPLGEDGQGERQ